MPLVRKDQSRDVELLSIGRSLKSPLSENYYFHKHDLKLAVDYTVAPHGIAQGKDGPGYITSTNMEAQSVFRMQMQVLF